MFGKGETMRKRICPPKGGFEKIQNYRQFWQRFVDFVLVGKGIDCVEWASSFSRGGANQGRVIAAMITKLTYLISSIRKSAYKYPFLPSK